MENDKAFVFEEWTGEKIIKKYESGELSIPNFQRSYVWPKKQQDEFYKSLKKEYPTGIVLVYKKDKKYFILDGLQRTTTLAKSFKEWDKLVDLYEGHYQKAIEEYNFKFNKENIDGIRNFIDNKNWKIMFGYKTYIKNNLSNFDETKKDERINFILNEFKGTIATHLFDSIKNFLYFYDEKIKKIYFKIINYKIPVQIWETKFSIKNAPEIFQKVNSQGIKLPPLIIIASSWLEKIKIHWKEYLNEKTFKEVVLERFQNLLDTEIVDAKQIENQNENNIFNALEVIYFISNQIISKIKIEEFKQIFYTQVEKNSKKTEINLEPFVRLIKIYIQTKKVYGHIIKTTDLDKELFQFLKQNNNIEEQINKIILDLSKSINDLINKIDILFKYDHKWKKKLNLAKRDAFSKTMFWTLLISLNFKSDNKIKKEKILEFIIYYFCKKTQLVGSSGSFEQIEKIIQNYSFETPIKHSELGNQISKEYFEKKFIVKSKKAEWEYMIIPKVLYYIFLHKFDLPKNLKWYRYFDNDDFGKNHNDLKNYNIFSNFFVCTSGSIDKNNYLESDYLFDEEKNEYLKQNYDKEIENIKKIKEHYKNFLKHKNQNNISSMNNQLKQFLQKRAKLIANTLALYFKN